MAQKVRDVMTARPVTLRPDASVLDAAQRMREHNIGNVFIVDDDDRLRGIVTDRDIVVRALADGRDPAATTVGEVCSEDLVMLGPDDNADDAVRSMRGYAIRRVPVVDRGQLVGVVTLGDMAIERDPRSALANISAATENR